MPTFLVMKDILSSYTLTLSSPILSFVIILKCVTCSRFKGVTMYQQMDNLPPPGVNPSLPFTHAGVNYAGSIQIRSMAGRGRFASVKGYIVVFVCLSSKAVHLEVAPSYDTRHFMRAFDRFIPEN